jgi:hypothetical protein
MIFGSLPGAVRSTTRQTLAARALRPFYMTLPFTEAGQSALPAVSSLGIREVW